MLTLLVVVAVVQLAVSLISLYGVIIMGKNQDAISAALTEIGADVTAIAQEITDLKNAGSTGADDQLADLATRATAAAAALDALKP